MKKQILAIALLLVTTWVFAQEYKLPKTSGKLMISEVNNVTIEGYDGKEIVFSSMDGVKEKDKRAEGLRAISAMGLEDNTGIGLSVKDNGNTVEVYQMKKMDGPKVKILVPKGVSILYSHSSPYGNSVKFKNVANEIEISTLHNSVHLDNVTGPLMVKTVHGSIDVIFGATINNPISIVSVHGAVDVTLPATTKANLAMSTSWGEMFVDPAIKIEFDGQGEWKKYGSNKVNGKLNGGGLEMQLSSTHNNIYLRKK
jgi:predicted membrane protein